MSKHLIVIAGPTGIGKTLTGIKTARHFNTEIVSSDSRQLFKELRIGTAVPSKEELSAAKHHFIHSHSIFDNYNASQYEKEAIGLLKQLFEKHNIDQTNNPTNLKNKHYEKKSFGNSSCFVTYLSG